MRKTERREKFHRVCPACRQGGYKVEEATDGRPKFTCTKCDHVWTCGLDGGPYVAPPRVPV
jgi:hypothetical protein